MQRSGYTVSQLCIFMKSVHGIPTNEDFITKQTLWDGDLGDLIKKVFVMVNPCYNVFRLVFAY